EILFGVLYGGLGFVYTATEWLGKGSRALRQALAVLTARLRVDTSSSDVYVSTVGWARAVEPATDLAVALAVVSAAQNLPTPPGLVAFGEVGLTGEVRATVGIQRRLA
nr:hypothetical protein [Streptococcus anginosus]